MKIIVKTLGGKEFEVDVENSDTTENLKLKIEKIYEVPADQQRIIFNGKEVEDNKIMDDYKINDGSILWMVVRLKGGGHFDEIKDEMDEFFEEDSKKGFFAKLFSKKKKEDNKEIGNNSLDSIDKNNKGVKKGFFANLFSKKKNDNNIINIEKEKEPNNEIIIDQKEKNEEDNYSQIDNNFSFEKGEFLKKYMKRDELNINLIYFDLNMTNKENYKYFSKFKVDVVGGFHAIDDLNVLKNYLEKIKEKNISFIVISSGSSGKDVIPLCKNYPFIKEVIIFCKNYNYNEHYINEYPEYVKKVLTNIKQVYEYIKTFGKDKDKDEIENDLEEDKYIFSSDEIKMDKQIQQCPLISSFEYDKLFFLVHKIYSHFFGDINNKYEPSLFKTENFDKILNYLDQLKFENDKEKNLMIEKFKNLVNLENNDIFIERSIRYYTGESNFCYLFNRVMRNFEKGLISFAYYMGPLLYGLNKYVKENPKFGFSKKMKLYRIIQCSKLDFYQYKLNFGHIICFPSLTSTSSIPIKFKPTKLSQKTNKNIQEEMVPIKMIFKYKHKSGNISPGIIIEDKKTKAGNYLSTRPKEKEVLLFPFTFAKIYKITSEIENNVKINVIKFEIVNRKSYIEYVLRNNFEKRILFNKLEEQ